MHCTKANSSATVESGLTERNRSSTFRSKNSFGPSEVADSRKKCSSISSRLKLDISETPMQPFWLHRGPMMQCLWRSWCLVTGTKPTRTNVYFKKSNWIPCCGCEQGFPATSFKRVRNVRVQAESRNGSNFAANSQEFPATCSIDKPFIYNPL